MMFSYYPPEFLQALVHEKNNTVITRVYVDLSRPENQSKNSPLTYTWVKT